MKGAPTIQERLWELRKDKGLNLEELAKQTGISKSALASYEANDYKEINHGNLITLADFYGVSLDYLFCRTENREQINTPLMELHLSDEMVELLKNGRINNRLLCELATHKDFIKFWRILKFMWTVSPTCKSRTLTPLLILSGMKSLNATVPVKMTHI